MGLVRWLSRHTLAETLMTHDPGVPATPPAKAAARQARRDRLAAELRANLRRRKAQGRARAEPEPCGANPPPGTEPEG
jgi:hypothetical protein